MIGDRRNLKGCDEHESQEDFDRIVQEVSDLKVLNSLYNEKIDILNS